MKCRYWFILMLTGAMVPGCSLFGTDDDARVVFGESIDDVVIGDDTSSKN